MKCGIRLSPCENSIAVITDDGDFVYSLHSSLLIPIQSSLFSWNLR